MFDPLCEECDLPFVGKAFELMVEQYRVAVIAVAVIDMYRERDLRKSAREPDGLRGYIGRGILVIN